MTMDHEEAAKGNWVERYLLHELEDAERDAFEEHYFSCPECAAELVTAAKFLDNARRPLMELVPETPPAASTDVPRVRWWERLLAPIPKPAMAGACALLAMIAVWQRGTPDAGPEVTGSYFVTATRAGETGPRVIPVAPGQQRIALLFNLTDEAVTAFRFTLEDASGASRLEFSGSAPRGTHDVQVLLPVAALSPGGYTLRVRNSAGGAEVAALPFTLERN